MKRLHSNKGKKLLACILTLSFVVSMFTFSMKFGDVAHAEGDTHPEYSYSSTDPLFAATHFHMFANDKIENGAHTHGNIAARGDVVGGEFGTRDSKSPSGTNDEYSYIGNLLSVNPAAQCGHLILAYGHTITSAATDTRGSVTNKSGTSMTFDHIPTANITVESKGFTAIDFDSEFAKLKSRSKEWAQKASSDKVTLDIVADQNKREIDCSATNTDSSNVYCSIPYGDFTTNLNKITIKGVDSDNSHTGLVVFNIDLKGQGDSVNMSFNQLIAQNKSGVDFGNAELMKDDYGTCRIVWNFFDSSKSDYVYTGAINMGCVMHGTILAPGADVTVGAVNGSVIANNIKHPSMESHRMDVLKETGISITTVPNTSAAPTATPAATQSAAPTATSAAGQSAAPTVTPVAGQSAAPTVTPASQSAAPTATAAGQSAAPTATAASQSAAPAGTPSTTVSTTTEVPNTVASAAPGTSATSSPTTSADPQNDSTKEYGILKITIIEEGTNRKIPDAKVQIIDSDGKVVKTVTTDENGKVVVKDIEEGQYSIKVISVPDGYKYSSKAKTVTVEANKTTTQRMLVSKGTSSDTDSDSDNSSDSDSTPQTGDAVNVNLLICLVAVSFVGGAWIYMKRRRI